MQSAVSGSGSDPTTAAIESPNVIERWFFRQLRGLEYGWLTIRFPSGRAAAVCGRNEGPNASVTLNSWSAVRRVLWSADMGFAEGYLAGDWETPDLTALLAFCLVNDRSLAGMAEQSWRARALGRLLHAMNANTRAGSRRNIAAHYDLGNAFYRPWLDETMTYSAAVFATPDESLAEAQARKYRRLADALDLQPGQRILEIGCGWGGFAEIAAYEYDCEIVCLTLSTEQADYARARIDQAGLADRVDIRLQDYRDTEGTFDHIVSIEMFEAVGEAYWPAYFGTLRDRLAPGGKAALQVITIAEDAFDDYRNRPDFIQRYIFPGGMLPSHRAIAEQASNAGFELTDSFFFGDSYAETLRRWDRSFEAGWKTIETLGFDDRFFRMWRYYLHYCIAGFDAGRIDVGHFLLEPQ
jgi:cyclopropane-fatty-acyl-phospholipid synthase